jgi:hypothetical protein
VLFDGRVIDDHHNYDPLDCVEFSSDELAAAYGAARALRGLSTEMLETVYGALQGELRRHLADYALSTVCGDPAAASWRIEAARLAIAYRAADIAMG